MCVREREREKGRELNDRAMNSVRESEKVNSERKCKRTRGKLCVSVCVCVCVCVCV